MYDISKAEVTLIWGKSKERWAAKEEFETIELRFHDISFFRIYQDSLSKQVHLDSNISYIGYLYPECLDIANGCLPPNDEDPSYHMVFGFESGMNIRIFSSEVVLQYF